MTIQRYELKIAVSGGGSMEPSKRGSWVLVSSLPKEVRDSLFPNLPLDEEEKQKIADADAEAAGEL